MLAPISNSWPDFNNTIIKVIVSDSVVKVLEIGGGVNPLLNESQVNDNNLEYTVVDIDPSELNKGKGNHYKKICLDISKNPIKEKYDLIFTHMVLEHIPNPSEFHQAVKNHLTSDGKAIHFFATKYSVASMTNLFLPSFITNFLIYKIQKRNPENEGKFKAYYSKCLGPTQGMKNYFNELGFKIIDFRGYTGHGYLSRYKFLFFFEKIYNRLVGWIDSPWFCSNAIVILKRAH